MLDTAFVLALMLLAEPKPTAAHRATFVRTAEAIARAANASPLFEGEEGAEKTAAVLVAVGWFESRLHPNAEGDCDKTTKWGTCEQGSRAHSFCLLQINDTNLAGLGTTKEEILADVDRCVSVGLRFMRTSFSICRTRPLEERLAWYARGSATCTDDPDATTKSRHRMLKAMWLWRRARDAKEKAAKG